MSIKKYFYRRSAWDVITSRYRNQADKVDESTDEAPPIRNSDSGVDNSSVVQKALESMVPPHVRWVRDESESASPYAIGMLRRYDTLQEVLDSIDSETEEVVFFASHEDAIVAEILSDYPEYSKLVI